MPAAWRSGKNGMESYQLPAAAAEFMENHIASADELALLVAMIDAPDRWWDPSIVSREFGLPQHVARAMLDRFAVANLLDIRVTGDVRYRFRPGTPELGRGATAFVEAYHAHPAVVAQHVARSVRRGVRDFADAFRIRLHGRR